MSAISGIDTGYTVPTTTTSSDDVSMGKNDFLLLLVAQLENQDPMNPSDPTEFTSQLAQFSQLEQLTNMNTSLEGLTAMSSEMERMSALGLIGQDVVAQTDKFHFNGEEMELGYRLDSQAEDVKMYILSESGATLATLSGEENDPGEYFVNWDGTSDSGTPLTSGDYSLIIRAVDGEDHVLGSSPLIRGRVEAVDMSGPMAELETTSGSFAMNKVEKAGVAL